MNINKGDGYILVENQKIKIKWNKRNKKLYENKGYSFKKYSDELIVNAEDLSKGSNYKVKVKCDYCGIIKDVAWKDYCKYELKYDKYSCSKCRQSKTSENTLYDRAKYLYDNALLFCNKKNYKLLTDIKEIKNSSSIVKCKCKKHGIFERKIYALILNHGCEKCQYDDMRLDVDKVKNDFNNMNVKLLNPYDYQNGSKKNLIVICKNCEKEYTSSYDNVIRYKNCLCEECSKSISNGEMRISDYLDNKCIKYIREFIFEDCRDIKPLPFDFYIPNMNICIEYQGRQHYESIEYFGGDERFKITKYHDSIKSNYCKNNNIELYTIPYTEYKNLNNYLDSIFNKCSHNDIV